MRLASLPIVALTLTFSAATAPTAEAQAAAPAATAALSLSSSAGVDANGSEAGDDARDPQYRGGRMSSDMRAGFNARGALPGKVQWQSAASTGFQFYPTLQEMLSTGYNGSVGIGFPIGRRTTVQVGESLGYVANYSLKITPAPASAPVEAPPEESPAVQLVQPDFSVARRPAYTSATTVSVTHGLSQRFSVSGSYESQRTAFLESSTSDLSSASASAGLRYRLAKSIGVHARYGRRLGHFEESAESGAASVDDIDVGLDYGRGLKLSRKTTLNLTSGGTTVADKQGRHYAMTGMASLNYAIGRSDRATLSYDRSVRLVEGFLRPVFADSLTGTLAVNPSARVRAVTSASYVTGNVGVGTSDNAYGAWTAAANMNVRMTRTAGVYLSYSYYQHRLGDGVELIEGVTSAALRHSLRVGVSAEISLIAPQRRRGR